MSELSLFQLSNTATELRARVIFNMCSEYNEILTLLMLVNLFTAEYRPVSSSISPQLTF